MVYWVDGEDEVGDLDADEDRDEDWFEDGPMVEEDCGVEDCCGDWWVDDEPLRIVDLKFKFAPVGVPVPGNLDGVGVGAGVEATPSSIKGVW